MIRGRGGEEGRGGGGVTSSSPVLSSPRLTIHGHSGSNCQPALAAVHLAQPKFARFASVNRAFFPASTQLCPVRGMSPPVRLVSPDSRILHPIMESFGGNARCVAGGIGWAIYMLYCTLSNSHIWICFFVIIVVYRGDRVRHPHRHRHRHTQRPNRP